jgi:Tol biopolymer transport system component
MKFRFVIGFFLLLVVFLTGCSVSQSSSKAAGDTLQKHQYPEGVLHFSGVVQMPSGQMGAGFSLLPEGEIIQMLQLDILPVSLQQHAGLIKPAWSVYDRKIVFAHISDKNLLIICSMDSDGKNFKIVYTFEPNEDIISPIWSASGQEVYFLHSSIAASGADKVTLCKMSADGRDFSKIAALSFPGTPMTLRLSSDGKHAACVYFVPPQGGVDGEKMSTEEYVVHVINPLTGSEEKMLSGFDAAWSPDSKKIAVIQQKPPAIQITDISTGAITSFNTGARFPKKIAWKPDGSKLAYISESEINNEERSLLQILTIENEGVYNVPIKIIICTSGLFWTY